MATRTKHPWAVGGVLLIIGAATYAQAPASPAQEQRPDVPPAARPQLPPGQVFECVNNGAHIFSDAPCGAHTTIRQLNDLNVMDSPAGPPVYRVHAPVYSPPMEQPGQYIEENPPEVASDPAVATQVIVVRQRLRREHFPPHVNRPHPQPRRN